MSQIKAKRRPTRVNLEAYNKVLDLSEYTMSACKPKQKKNSDGSVSDDNHHVPMRYKFMGDDITRLVCEAGGLILEANEIYVAKNIQVEVRIRHYHRRIELQERAIGHLFRVEHMVNMLQMHRPFAESTIRYWTGLIVTARAAVIAWCNGDKESLRGCSL